MSLQLLLRGHEWVNRCVETVHLIDEQNVRLRLSLDFRLPELLPGGLRLGGETVHFIPVTFLERRGDLAFFDVRDEEGESVPLLTRRDNGLITGVMLVSAAQRAVSARRLYRGVDLELSEQLKAYLIGIPTQRRQFSREFLQAVLDRKHMIYPDERVAEVLLRDGDFRSMLAICATSSAIHVPLRGPLGRRRIIKVSWEQGWRTSRPAEHRQASRIRRWSRGAASMLGWRPYSPWLVRPAIGGAETYHAQVTAPPDVSIVEAGVVTYDPSEALKTLGSDPSGHVREGRERSAYEDFVGGFTDRAHLYLPRAHELRIGVLWVRLRASREGFLPGAFLTALLVTGLLILFWRNAHDILGQSEVAAAVLLVVPALIAGFLVRPGEHAMSRRLVRVARYLTTFLAALQLVAVALLVAVSEGEDGRRSLIELFVTPTREADEKLTTGWLLLGLLAGLTTVVLGLSWLLPRPGRRERRQAPAEGTDVYSEDGPRRRGWRRREEPSESD